jgi:integrase/recombinase XerD
MEPLASVPASPAAKKSQVRPYGQKSAFSPADVAAIRHRLPPGTRDRALFELAICTALRASDLLCLRVSDVQDAAGVIRARITVGQRKTRKGVPVNLAPAAEALKAHIEDAKLLPDAPLFSAHRRRVAKPMTVEAFRQLVKRWADMAGHRDVSRYAAHSTRRTLAAAIYARKKDVASVRHVLGHSSTAATAHYLGIDVDAALDVALECAL